MKRKSPGFSNFRELMDVWDEAVSNQEKASIQSMVESNEFVFFFLKDGEVFATSEEGRLTFARMKNPPEEDVEWMKEANFMAVNLDKALRGKKIQSLFGHDDLDKIQVIEQEKAITKLVQKAKKIPTSEKKINQNLSTPGDEEAPDVPANMDKIKEK